MRERAGRDGIEDRSVPRHACTCECTDTIVCTTATRRGGSAGRGGARRGATIYGQLAAKRTVTTQNEMHCDPQHTARRQPSHIAINWTRRPAGPAARSAPFKGHFSAPRHATPRSNRLVINIIANHFSPQVDFNLPAVLARSAKPPRTTPWWCLPCRCGGVRCQRRVSIIMGVPHVPAGANVVTARRRRRRRLFPKR